MRSNGNNFRGFDKMCGQIAPFPQVGKKKKWNHQAVIFR